MGTLPPGRWVEATARLGIRLNAKSSCQYSYATVVRNTIFLHGYFGATIYSFSHTASTYLRE